MGKIRKLDDQLSNLIAAGEVVERPASVIKELVENAIDANSTTVDVYLEEAGLSLMRIVDNGDGMEADDCLVAFDRHATSKLQDENDLFRIRTLGFRGEALPSIASVSEVELITSTGMEAGTRIVIKGGDVMVHEKTASRKGTDITVRQLFFNTPARLKYMKTIHTELGNVTDIVNRIALSHADVSIRLFHNGKKLLHTPGNGDVRQVLAAIYGLQTARKMIPIKAQSLDFTITGYVALPEITRASRHYISTIVNGRYVRNYALVKAIQQGYHTLLPIGRYPIGFFSIEMDPMLVDVNVHPAKLEVRFSKEAELLQLLTHALQQAFQKVELIPAVAAPKKAPQQQTMQPQLQFTHTLTEEPIIALPTGMLVKEPVQEHVPVQTIVEDVAETVEEDTSFTEELEITYETDVAFEQDEKEGGATLPPLYPIGQMHGTYILAQNEKGLYMIDQHAAQERIHYEYFREKVGRVAPDVQELLLPYRIDLSLKEYLQIEEQIEELQKVGIFLESFGQQSFIVRSHPTWFPKGQEVEIIEELMQQVLRTKKADIKKLREEAAIMMSCKASIKANQHLKQEEIFALLEDLRKTTNPYTCPHGRPIVIHYSTYELEKMFKRVM